MLLQQATSLLLLMEESKTQACNKQILQVACLLLH